MASGLLLALSILDAIVALLLLKRRLVFKRVAVFVYAVLTGALVISGLVADPFSRSHLALYCASEFATAMLHGVLATAVCRETLRNYPGLGEWIGRGWIICAGLVGIFVAALITIVQRNADWLSAWFYGALTVRFAVDLIVAVVIAAIAIGTRALPNTWSRNALTVRYGLLGYCILTLAVYTLHATGIMSPLVQFVVMALGGIALAAAFTSLTIAGESIPPAPPVEYTDEDEREWQDLRSALPQLR